MITIHLKVEIILLITIHKCFANSFHTIANESNKKGDDSQSVSQKKKMSHKLIIKEKSQ